MGALEELAAVARVEAARVPVRRWRPQQRPAKASSVMAVWGLIFITIGAAIIMCCRFGYVNMGPLAVLIFPVAGVGLILLALVCKIIAAGVREGRQD